MCFSVGHKYHPWKLEELLIRLVSFAVRKSPHQHHETVLRSVTEIRREGDDWDEGGSEWMGTCCEQCSTQKGAGRRDEVQQRPSECSKAEHTLRLPCPGHC